MVEKEKLIKNDSNKKKEQKSSSKSGIFTYIVGAYGALVTGILVALLVSKYEPESFSIPPPPKFEGPLALNKKLQGAELLLKDQVKGPESLIVEGDTIYVAPEDGRILKVVNGKIVKEVILVDDKVCQTSEGRFKNLEKCGRPLGMRQLNKDLIIFADAYLGIVTVDVEKGKTNILLAGDAVVDGVQMKFADDLDVLDENTVIFSDASTKYQYKTCVYGYLESKPDGRIIQLNIKTKEAKVLLEGLYFPNGVQLFPDKQSFLVSETHRDRLKRFYISGPKKGQQEIFVNNLPGAPDNVRLNSRGNFYVAIAYTRHPDKFFLWDFLGPYPWVRNLILQLIPDSYLTAFQLSFIHKHGLVVEIDNNGKYISSLHDPTGVVKFLSEVHETDKYIYVASFNQPHIARVTK
uniref:Strictosidine synthase conserved region domain-containing protein n=1 Tax=Acrobeloides nanus TaxID=290746 RepID=A0A914EBF4_9BILA